MGHRHRPASPPLLLSPALLGLWLVLAPQTAIAQDRLIPGVSASEESRAIFVLGNTLFALYHEAAHVLLDQFDIRTSTRPEDMADVFAIVQLTPPTLDATSGRLLRAAAEGWLLYAETGPIDDLAYLDQRRLDEDRFYATACLFVGADPLNLFEYALDVGLPPDRIDQCPDAFDAARTAWDGLLAAHRGDPAASDAPGFSLDWEAPPAFIEPLQSFVRNSGLIDGALARLDDIVQLRREVRVVFAPCGGAAVTYTPDDDVITMCQELLAHFDNLIQFGLDVR